jgi:SAM-dependent methyltransferase
MSSEILREHRQTWQKKPVLRAIYTDFYQRITTACRPGLSLEIGGGSGNLKDFSAHVVSTDIVPSPWLDAAADAQALPFAAGSFANVVAVDVLHHIERPSRFLAEAERVLQGGGRIILVEPAITPISWIFYRLFHPEPVVLRADPLADGPLDPGRQPFDANQAIPTLLFGRYRQRLKQVAPNLELITLERFSLLAYPLSGGFRPWCLIPAACIGRLLDIERILAPVLGPVMAFRLFAVLEKRAGQALR